MPKKKRSAKKARRKPFWLKLLVIVTCFTIAFLGIALIAKMSTSKLPCANSISCIKDLSGKYEPNAQGTFMGKVVNPPAYIAESEPQTQVLGQMSLAKHIYVDLTNQRLTAREGDKLVFDFPVSTGKWGPTPTGDFRIWVKLRYTRMTGGDAADGTFYDLPNVPYVMFFQGDGVAASRGFSLHGAYWHNNFGHPMSHGCVNMRIEDVAKLYAWADPPTEGNTTYAKNDNGTPITIFGTPPDQ